MKMTVPEDRLILEKRIPHYRAVHHWLYYHYGKADHCENNPNHKSYRYEWANISGKYKRDRFDFKSLCVSCHRKMDFTEETRVRLYKLSQQRIGQSAPWKWKKVKQYTKEMILIKEWECISLAAQTLNISRTSISNNVKGRIKTSGGYIWQN